METIYIKKEPTDLESENATLRAQLKSAQSDNAQLASYITELLKVKDTLVYAIVGNEHFLERRSFSLVDSTFKQLNRLVDGRPKCFTFIPKANRKCELLADIVPVEVITLDDDDEDEQVVHSGEKSNPIDSSLHLKAIDPTQKESSRDESMDMIGYSNKIESVSFKLEPKEMIIKAPTNITQAKPEMSFKVRQLRSLISKDLIEEESARFKCDPCGGKSFSSKTTLQNHQDFFHLGIRYKCAWQGCKYVRNKKYDVIVHVRVNHFQLPATIKMQRKMKIVDDRVAGQFVEKVSII